MLNYKVSDRSLVCNDLIIRLMHDNAASWEWSVPSDVKVKFLFNNIPSLACVCQ